MRPAYQQLCGDWQPVNDFTCEAQVRLGETGEACMQRMRYSPAHGERFTNCDRSNPSRKRTTCRERSDRRRTAFVANEDLRANALQDLVEADPNVLEQRMSRFEHAATPLHFAATRAEVRMVELLIQLGAALEATDDRGRAERLKLWSLARVDRARRRDR